MSDVVTGARTEAELLVELPQEQLWALVTDVRRYGEWSPECVSAEWLGAAASRPARAGDRYAARNEFGNGMVTHVECEITELREPEVFAWDVLDDSGLAGSRWRYELTAADRPGWTVLRHVFEHGPGETYVRVVSPDDPGVVGRRLDQLRGNMYATLAAMLSGVRYEEVER